MLSVTKRKSVTLVLNPLQDIPEVYFSDEYATRFYRNGDWKVWERIVRKSDPHAPQGIFSITFGDDANGLEQRLFFIINMDGLEIGTSVAWRETWNGVEWGYLARFAILPEYQGQGLGTAAMAESLRIMRQLHDRCFIRTTNGNIPMIKICLKFGFKPYIINDDTCQLWQDIKRSGIIGNNKRNFNV